MSGITAQSVMRRKHGLIVTHVRTESGYAAQLIHEGSLIFESPDDCLASASVLLTNKVWSLLPSQLLAYDMQPAYCYLQGKNVPAAMKDFERPEFERNLLPQFKEVEALKNHVQVYEANCGEESEIQTYLLYDVLVRLLCYAREHRMTVARDGIAGMEVVDAIAGLKDSTATCIDVTDSPFLDALKVIHVDANETVIDGRVYLIKAVPINTYGCVRGAEHRDLPDAIIARVLSGEKIQAITTGSPALGVIAEEDKLAMTNLVGQILGRGGVTVTSEEKELVAFSKGVCGIGKTIGKNALMGLGNIVGEGPLAERLQKLYEELNVKVRGLLSPADTFKLAASRLASMSSAKVLTTENGTVCLRDRVVLNGVAGRDVSLA